MYALGSYWLGGAVFAVLERGTHAVLDLSERRSKKRAEKEFATELVRELEQEGGVPVSPAGDEGAAAGVLGAVAAGNLLHKRNGDHHDVRASSVESEDASLSASSLSKEELQKRFLLLQQQLEQLLSEKTAQHAADELLNLKFPDFFDKVFDEAEGRRMSSDQFAEYLKAEIKKLLDVAGSGKEQNTAFLGVTEPEEEILVREFVLDEVDLEDGGNLAEACLIAKATELSTTISPATRFAERLAAFNKHRNSPKYRQFLAKIKAQSAKFLSGSLILWAGMALHNAPEGILTYMTFVDGGNFGALLALGIIVHNFPEGWVTAAPYFNAITDKYRFDEKVKKDHENSFQDEDLEKKFLTPEAADALITLYEQQFVDQRQKLLENVEESMIPFSLEQLQYIKENHIDTVVKPGERVKAAIFAYTGGLSELIAALIFAKLLPQNDEPLAKGILLGVITAIMTHMVQFNIVPMFAAENFKEVVPWAMTLATYGIMISFVLLKY